ncbi:TatD family hydrolase [Sphingobacterium sp. MYb382]|uniref:TatD family hydrolase n=1 Tax=Sphingobacterium sp. MYb382 TaxID=2745278 RepID=UPI0030A4FA0B
MHVPLVNIHTHHIKENTAAEFSLPNIIVSKNYLITQPCSLGIHPWYIDTAYEAQLDVLYEHGRKTQVLAIGECGLDKLCDTEWHMQVLLFERQIALANQLKKPLIIHCVRAYQECLQLLRQHKVSVPVMFHGFEKNVALAQQIVREGYYLSMGTALLHGKKDELVHELPLDRIFLETDNQSCKIESIYDYVATTKNMERSELAQQLYSNFTQVFEKSS